MKIVICFTVNNQSHIFEIRAILLSTHPNCHLSGEMAQQTLSDFIFLSRKYQELSNDVYFILVCPILSTSHCLIVHRPRSDRQILHFLKEGNITIQPYGVNYDPFGHSFWLL